MAQGEVRAALGQRSRGLSQMYHGCWITTGDQTMGDQNLLEGGGLVQGCRSGVVGVLRNCAGVCQPSGQGPVTPQEGCNLCGLHLGNRCSVACTPAPWGSGPAVEQGLDPSSMWKRAKHRPEPKAYASYVEVLLQMPNTPLQPSWMAACSPSIAAGCIWSRQQQQPAAIWWMQ